MFIEFIQEFSNIVGNWNNFKDFIPMDTVDTMDAVETRLKINEFKVHNLKLNYAMKKQDNIKLSMTYNDKKSPAGENFLDMYYVNRNTLVSCIDEYRILLPKVKKHLLNLLEEEEVVLRILVCQNEDDIGEFEPNTREYCCFIIESLECVKKLTELCVELIHERSDGVLSQYDEQRHEHLKQYIIQLETEIKLNINQYLSNFTQEFLLEVLDTNIDHFAEDISRINDVQYTPSKILNENKIQETYKLKNTMEMGCVICQDDEDTDTRCKVDCCGHVYHNKCIVQWLTRKDTCPSCRTSLVK